jgi:hypothetical protein
MPLEFRLHRFTVLPTKANPSSDSVTFPFDKNRVINVLVAISSFKFQYSRSDRPDRKIADHHLGVAQIETAVNVSQAGNSLDLLVKTFLLRDASPSGDPNATLDDFYEGFVDVQLLVETA